MSGESKPIRVLSLGAGVQSTTVLLMACAGEIPPIDHAVFADTGCEPKAVYQHLDWLTRYAADHGITVRHVSGPDLAKSALDYRKSLKGKWYRPISLPYFCQSPDGKVGQVQRQCTAKCKIKPIHRTIKRLLGLRPGAPWPESPVVTTLVGISADEAHRYRHPDGPWEIKEHPLIDRRMTRLDCLVWLEKMGHPRPPRSSCKQCPFHSDRDWHEMKTERPDEWEECVAFDRAIREMGGNEGGGKLYLHKSCRPLSEVRFNLDPTPDMFGNECHGLCGV